jgi:tripartite-type tricarboxylate transporter receptor subunit TctC
MKKLFASIIVFFAATVTAQTKEIITVVIPASPAQSSTPLTQKMIDRANDQQTKYTFVAEFKPGGNGTVGMKYMDLSPTNRVVGVAPAFIENARSGLINENDYVPIHAAGDVCWAVITNVGDSRRGVESLSDLKGKEIIVGGTGYGNAAHITSLLLAEKYGFKVKYVVFKSNFEAVVNMVGDNGVNMALESIKTYEQFKSKQPKLQMLGFNCPQRSDQAPDLRTLREQGINAPTIWNLTMANRAMPEEKRKEIGAILEAATKSIGPKEFSDIAGLFPPVFRGIRPEVFANDRINLQKELVRRFEKEIEASK